MNQVYFSNKLNQKKIETDVLNKKNGQTKFENCQHRSDQPVSKIVKRCSCQGGNYEVSGYQCLKRDIFNINSEVCNYCSQFLSKQKI